jgi:hypothetical protein
LESVSRAASVTSKVCPKRVIREGEERAGIGVGVVAGELEVGDQQALCAAS